MPVVAPHGTWRSPIDATDAVAGLVAFADLTVDRGDVYWVEMRPTEGGRQVLVRRDAGGTITDLTSAPLDVRTRVHEYGGGAFAVRDGEVVFSEFSDQRLYRLGTGSPITAEPPRAGSERFADGRLLTDGRMVCVRESHPERGEARNEVVMVDITDGRIEVLATGRDFYASPRPTPDGSALAWLEWDHPNMPWDGTELRIAALTPHGLASPETIAGGRDESVFQPEWAPDGGLVFSTDRSGWWNLHRFDGSTVEPVLERDVDFGDPAWIFGRTAYGFLSGGRILAGFWENGRHRLGVIDANGSMTLLVDEYGAHERLVTDGESRAWFVATGPASPTAVVELNVDTGERTMIRSNPMPVDPAYLSEARLISFPTGGDAVAHAVFYPPSNPDFEPPPGERPPLIVRVHGGPTSHVYPRLTAAILYWTTRGFGLVDVNYRGSTGFGRRFRQALRGNWGVVDVEDCIAAATHLARQGKADPDRMVITGGSAGGYTTLAALAFEDVFAAGASYYGVADIELLAAHTHKFESRYLDGLVGTDPSIRRRRSPLFSADRISSPVILFQGLEDRVVPPEQAEEIAAALEANGVAHAHVTYQGEDHGFRRAENIVHSLESELGFFGEVLGFRPVGDIPPVPIVRG